VRSGSFEAATRASTFCCFDSRFGRVEIRSDSGVFCQPCGLCERDITAHRSRQRLQSFTPFAKEYASSACAPVPPLTRSAWPAPCAHCGRRIIRTTRVDLSAKVAPRTVPKKQPDQGKSRVLLAIYLAGTNQLLLHFCRTRRLNRRAFDPSLRRPGEMIGGEHRISAAQPWGPR